MTTPIRRIELNKLVAHPGNANSMSRASFVKLVRHIERTGRYEPLVVRPHPQRPGDFQIINGQHRCRALRQLGHEAADAVVWDVSDEETAMLLATLNRLGGRDVLDRKLALLRGLKERTPTRELAKLLPQTRGQLERLTARRLLPPARVRTGDPAAIPLVFFVDEQQRSAIEQALSLAGGSPTTRSRALERAAALTCIARRFQGRGEPSPQG